jgi:hypothetical protein
MEEKRYRYFLYSQQQYDSRTAAELSLGKTYIPGKVLNRGRWKEFTEISASPSNSMYADAKIVAEGYLDSMRYTMNTSEWRTR